MLLSVKLKYNKTQAIKFKNTWTKVSNCGKNNQRLFIQLILIPKRIENIYYYFIFQYTQAHLNIYVYIYIWQRYLALLYIYIWLSLTMHIIFGVLCAYTAKYLCHRYINCFFGSSFGKWTTFVCSFNSSKLPHSS